RPDAKRIGGGGSGEGGELGGYRTPIEKEFQAVGIYGSDREVPGVRTERHRARQQGYCAIGNPDAVNAVVKTELADIVLAEESSAGRLWHGIGLEPTAESETAQPVHEGNSGLASGVGAIVTGCFVGGFKARKREASG